MQETIAHATITLTLIDVSCPSMMFKIQARQLDIRCMYGYPFLPNLEFPGRVFLQSLTEPEKVR